MSSEYVKEASGQDSDENMQQANNNSSQLNMIKIVFKDCAAAATNDDLEVAAFTRISSKSQTSRKSKFKSKLSLKTKGRKTFSPQQQTPTLNLRNLKKILQPSGHPTKFYVKKLSLTQQSSHPTNLDVQKLSQTQHAMHDESPRRKPEDKVIKAKETKTRSARVSSVLKKPDFLSGNDLFWSSDDEFVGISGRSEVVGLDDDDWKPVGTGGKQMSKKRIDSSQIRRNHLGKRKLFSIESDYMDDSAESDEDYLQNEKTQSSPSYSGSRDGVFNSVKKLRIEGSMSNILGSQVITPRLKRR